MEDAFNTAHWQETREEKEGQKKQKEEGGLQTIKGVVQGQRWKELKGKKGEQERGRVASRDAHTHDTEL